jgi:sugar lactone lactonase YvrE
MHRLGANDALYNMDLSPNLGGVNWRFKVSYRILSRLLLASLLGIVACAPDRDETQSTADRAPYTLDGFELPGETFYPEGVAVAADGTFFVGSLSTGQVVRLRPGEDTVEEFVPTGAISTAAGMVVDEERAVLWVCDSSLTKATPAIVGVALADGTVVGRHAFPAGPALCNDLALDAEGNLYATDSFAPRILRVAADRKLEDGAAEVWATEPAWAVEPGQFGLNGITAADGGIYIAHTQRNALYHVPIAAGGAAGAAREVELDRIPNGLDGLEPAADGGLIFAEGYANSLTHIALGDDGTGSLRVLADKLAGPTTFALFAGSAWVVEGQLSIFFDPSSGSPALPFRVRRVMLEGGLVAP